MPSDSSEANAIQIHVNRAQELVMPEGDRVFSNWLRNIEEIVKTSAVPRYRKEVGFGFSRESHRTTGREYRIDAIDISGTGGNEFRQNRKRPSQRKTNSIS